MKVRQYLLLFLLVFIIFVSKSYAKKNSVLNQISNQMILEKLELYQSINEKKSNQADNQFKLLIEITNQLREDMNKRFDQLREDMNKRFDLLVEVNNQLREDMNKRFDLLVEKNNQLREDMNKRFEQVDRRFEFIQQIYLALMALTVGTPFIIEMRRNRKKQKVEDEIREEIRENKKEMKIVVAAIQELAKIDENIRNALKKVDQKGIFFNPHPAYA